MTTAATQRYSIRTLLFAGLALALGLGWLGRERAFATQKAEALKSATINLADVTMKPDKPGGELAGHIGIYLQGDTAKSRDFVTGRYAIEPGKTPHPPHNHVEEEVMIVESGTGEILCDGKTTKVGPGSVMYTAPNVFHGILNTGATPLVFYFMKWSATQPR